MTAKGTPKQWTGILILMANVTRVAALSRDGNCSGEANRDGSKGNPQRNVTGDLLCENVSDHNGMGRNQPVSDAGIGWNASQSDAEDNIRCNASQPAVSDVDEGIDTLQTSQMTIRMILTPAIALIGCGCSIVVLAVLSNPTMKSSYNTFLKALCLADFSFLIVFLLRWTFLLMKDYNVAMYNRVLLSINYIIIDNLLNLGTGRTSNILVMLLSIERFIAINFPLKAKMSPFHRHPVKVIVLTTLIVFAILVPNQLKSEHTVTSDCPNVPVEYRNTQFRKDHARFYKVYFTFLLMSLRLIPVLVVLITNVAIVITLISAAKSNLRAHTNVDSVRQAEQVKLTKILVAVAVIFLVCVSPGLVHSCLAVFAPEYRIGGQNRKVWRLTYAIFSCCDVINSTVNIFVYLIAMRKFRSIFLQKFGCKRTPKRSVYSKPLSESSTKLSSPLQSTVSVTQECDLSSEGMQQQDESKMRSSPTSAK